MKNLIIEGFIGSGKGAVGRLLGKTRNMEFIDLDKKVSEKMNMTSAEIYDKFGEVYYRAMETFVLSNLAKTAENSVIVLGSGVAMMPQNAPYLKQLGTVIYLKLHEDQILKNMKKSHRHQWIQSEGWDEHVKNIYKEREPAYRKTADITIDGNQKTTKEMVEAINTALEKDK
jgi:shikimate kinase